MWVRLSRSGESVTSAASTPPAHRTLMAANSLRKLAFLFAERLWRRRRAGLVLAAAAAAGLGVAAAPRIGVLWAIGAGAGLFLVAAAAFVAIGALLRLRAAFVDVSRSVAALQGEIASVRTAVEALSRAQARETGEFRQGIAQLTTKTRDLGFALEERTNIHAAKLAALATDAKRHARAMDIRAAEQLAQFKKVDDRLALKASAERLARLDDQARDTDTRTRDLDAGLADLRDRARGFHVHDRTLGKDDLAALRADWAEPLGLPRTERAIAYLATRVAAVESRCAGRLATASQTMIARLLAAESLGGPSVRILEIGVLFGVASACFYEVLKERNVSAHLTLIDPLDGYYAKDTADVVTGVAVSRALLDRNLAAAGVPSAAVEVVQKFSDDPDVLAAVAGRDFDLLLIDGDHSFDGVRRDFVNYGPLVREGGVILFDDYAVREWPDIKKFVDEGPATDPALRLLATGFRTAAFRVETRLRRA